MSEPRVRRIVVGIDGSEHSAAALVAGAELASRLHAEVHGLFVEDVNLLRLGGMPFARELRLPTGTPRALVSGTIEGEMAGLAARARRALMQVAERLHVQWSFRVQRGRVEREVLAASVEADLLLLGWASRPLSPRVRLGSVARAALLEGGAPVLLCRRGQTGLRSLVVVYEAALAGGAGVAATVMDSALAYASLLMDIGMESLTVLVQGGSVDEVRALERRVTARLGRAGIAARMRQIIDREGRGTALALCHAVQAEPEGLVVLAKGSQLLGPAGQGGEAGGSGGLGLLDELGCPVLVLR